jgi:hypothetical protein
MNRRDSRNTGARIADYIDVKAMRKASGKTLGQLIDAADGMGIRDWCHIESGYNGATLSTLERVAKGFNCRVEIKLIPKEAV